MQLVRRGMSGRVDDERSCGVSGERTSRRLKGCMNFVLRWHGMTFSCTLHDGLGRGGGLACQIPVLSDELVGCELPDRHRRIVTVNVDAIDCANVRTSSSVTV